MLVHGGGEGVVDRHVPLLLLAVLQEGKIGDPDRSHDRFVYQAQLKPQLHPEAAEGLRHNPRAVTDREEKVARTQLETPDEPLENLRAKELGHRRLQPPCGHPKGGKALRPETLHELGEVVDYFAGERLGLPLHFDPLDLAPAGEGVREGAEGGAGAEVTEVAEEHLESGIRLVEAVSRHRLVIPQAREGPVQLHPLDLTEDGGDELLHEDQHVLPIHERHLDVYLGKLGLPVGPQVLIAEAPHDLEVAVKAGHHQELLEELGRLRQREELAGVEPGRHQIVPGPFGGAPGQRRGLYLDEAMPVEEGSDHLGCLMADAEISLQRRPAEVEIPIGEAELFAHGPLLIQGKDRGPGLIEDERFGGRHLHLAGLQVHILGPGRAAANLARHGDHILRPHPPGGLVGVRAVLGPKEDLHDPLAVPEVHKDEAPVIPPPVDPAHQRDGLADLFRRHLSAIIASPHASFCCARSSPRVNRSTTSGRGTCSCPPWVMSLTVAIPALSSASPTRRAWRYRSLWARRIWLLTERLSISRAARIPCRRSSWTSRRPS